MRAEVYQFAGGARVALPKAPGGSRWDAAPQSLTARLGKCPDGDGSRHPARFCEGLLEWVETADSDLARPPLTCYFSH